MKYTNYTNEQIVSPIYDEVAQKLLALAQNEGIKSKVQRNII